MASFIPAEVIKKKRNNQPLRFEEIQTFVNTYVEKKIPDYQMSALLMAIFFNGLNREEMSHLTQIMRDSGYKFTFDGLHCVDKHSTGGVGDKTSMILAPIAAACGVHIPMIGGRGLGHTGGTLDKLESIPGFRCDLSKDEFYHFVKEHRVALIGQTQDICPADKMMYALRDVTATVESIPLICASIMSKKLAEGISSLVLDVKMGSGAFMKTQQDAEALAKSLISIGVDNLVNTVALVTNMDQPLGKFVGNALEIQECLDILKGKTNEENGFDFYQDTRDLSLELAAQMIYCSKNASSLQNARQLAQEALENGKAYSVFEDLCRRQGGIDLSQLPASNSKIDIMSEKNGFIDHINVEKIGLASILLGAGRKTKEDSIDPSAGIEIHFKHGFKKTKGEKLFTVYFSGDRPVEDVKELLLESLSFSNQKPQTLPLIYKVLTEKDL